MPAVIGRQPLRRTRRIERRNSGILPASRPGLRRRTLSSAAPMPAATRSSASIQTTATTASGTGRKTRLAAPNADALCRIGTSASATAITPSLETMFSRVVTARKPPNADRLNPQRRTIAKFRPVPAAPPSGRTFETALPVRLSVRPRRFVSPGRDAARTNECAHNPAIQTTARTTTAPAETRPRTAPTSPQVAPTARGSSTTRAAVASPLRTEVTTRRGALGFIAPSWKAAAERILRASRAALGGRAMLGKWHIRRTPTLPGSRWWLSTRTRTTRRC